MSRTKWVLVTMFILSFAIFAGLGESREAQLDAQKRAPEYQMSSVATGTNDVGEAVSRETMFLLSGNEFARLGLSTGRPAPPPIVEDDSPDVPAYEQFAREAEKQKIGPAEQARRDREMAKLKAFVVRHFVSGQVPSFAHGAVSTDDGGLSYNGYRYIGYEHDVANPRSIPEQAIDLRGSLPTNRPWSVFAYPEVNDDPSARKPAIRIIQNGQTKGLKWDYGLAEKQSRPEWKMFDENTKNVRPCNCVTEGQAAAIRAFKVAN